MMMMLTYRVIVHVTRKEGRKREARVDVDVALAPLCAAAARERRKGDRERSLTHTRSGRESDGCTSTMRGMQQMTYNCTDTVAAKTRAMSAATGEGAIACRRVSD